MTGLMIFLCLILIAIVVVQVGKVAELASSIRGEEEVQDASNSFHAMFGMVFLVLFLVGCVVSAWMYKDSMLGYGPHTAATEHGGALDSLFNVTLLFTVPVFIATHIALFWFAYKYKAKEGRRVMFLAHDNKLEVIWTIIPAVVMCFLVMKGLVTWNKVMADTDTPFVEIEATGQQFAWIMRYPGDDGVLGTKNFRLIDGTNELGMDWTDEKSQDDIISSAAGEVVKVPLGKEVRVRITAKDVLHNFDVPHFRVKMDAVPGIPSYFKFVPNTTTEEYRERLGQLDKEGNPMYPEWHMPADEDEPDGPKRYEAFHYELACAELCGKGHYSMKRLIEVVPLEEWEEWMINQKSYYFANVRGKDFDPNKDTKVLPAEIRMRSKNFKKDIKTALASDDEAAKTLQFKYVNFVTGSSNLTPNSKYELKDLVKALESYPKMNIELAGHTDNVGDPTSNMTLSNDRAQTVFQFLVDQGVSSSRMTAVGYGDSKPMESNDTAEGRAKNRRTEFTIKSN